MPLCGDGVLRRNVVWREVLVTVTPTHPLSPLGSCLLGRATTGLQDRELFVSLSSSHTPFPKLVVSLKIRSSTRPIVSYCANSLRAAVLLQCTLHTLIL